MTKEELILDFCAQFRDLGAENCFLNGMCFWFANILHNRFNDEDVAIMYAAVDNHFACKINGRVYDVTGDVTDKYSWQNWQMYAATDKLHTLHLYRDCIMKYPSNHVFCGACGNLYIDDWGNLICGCDDHLTGRNEQCTFEGE
jgi:hypothetical protein